MHSREDADDVAEARRLGGFRRRRPDAASSTRDFDGLNTVDDLLGVLEVAVRDTLGQQNSTARSRTLGYLVWIALKAQEASVIEDRLSALEATVLPRHRRADGQ